MRIREAQQRIAREFLSRDHARGPHATLTWLVEEIGELAEAIIKGDRESLSEEIADVIAWTLSLASLYSIDVEEALKKKYPFLARD